MPASYEDLNVYRSAFELQQRIFEESKSWPKEETFALTDQIRRASRAIGANIAEAFGKRRYAAHFASKLTDADAEQLETRYWLLSAKECGYLGDAGHAELLEQCQKIGRMLGKMLNEPERWLIE